MKEKQDENHYVQTYQEHYKNNLEILSVETAERILTNFVHLQEVMNQNIHDVAKLLGQVLQSQIITSQSNTLLSQKIGAENHPLGLPTTTQFYQDSTNHQYTNKNHSLSKFPQSLHSGNRNPHKEFLIQSSEDLSALKKKSHQLRDAQLKLGKDNNGVPHSNTNVIDSNSAKEYNSIRSPTNNKEQTISNCNYRDPSNRFIIESNINSNLQNKKLEYDTVNNLATETPNPKATGMASEIKRSRMRIEFEEAISTKFPQLLKTDKHKDFYDQDANSRNSTLVNFSEQYQEVSKNAPETDFSAYLFNKEQLVFRGKSFERSKASKLNNNAINDENIMTKAFQNKRTQLHTSGNRTAKDSVSCLACFKVK
jgi:hypothetical protein